MPTERGLTYYGMRVTMPKKIDAHRVAKTLSFIDWIRHEYEICPLT